VFSPNFFMETGLRHYANMNIWTLVCTSIKFPSI